MKTPEQFQFQGSAEIKGFKPLDFGSAVPSYQQYGEQQSNALRKAQELEGRNLDAVGRYKADQAGKDMMALARFSETLSGVLMTEAKKQNEREQEEGLNMAYMDGFSPEAIAEFDAKEAELRLADEGIQSYADYSAKMGSPFMGVQKIRELSGWKAYGYAMGMAQQAGLGYADAMSQALAELPPGASVAEKSAALATARGRYMSQTGLVGMNPMLSNKYAFPMMKRNTVHLRLLKFLGFKFLREFTYGPNNLTFIEFCRVSPRSSSSS